MEIGDILGFGYIGLLFAATVARAIHGKRQWDRMQDENALEAST